ncbi:hypothetical protein HJD18_16375 [Thermoleophilia bacterium SCSIO 60948]|nr:hypothetical protein HJD18_16375 [Thermoleophilia bacterium SCSIO 60948]
MDERGLIRSYQRIFRPERRLYQVEGRSLPVPGGVPLRWLAWASGSLLCVLVLSSGSAVVALLAAAAAALGGLALGGRASALAAAALAALGVPVAGFLLGLLGWPLRFVVLPALLATLATQATPDGRRADRFALSWVALRLAPRRRSLGRALPPAGQRRRQGGRLWVAADERQPRLRRARLRGPVTAVLASRARIAPRRLRRGAVVRPLGRGRPRGAVVDSIELGEGELAEVWP